MLGEALDEAHGDWGVRMEAASPHYPSSARRRVAANEMGLISIVKYGERFLRITNAQKHNSDCDQRCRDQRS